MKSLKIGDTALYVYIRSEEEILILTAKALQPNLKDVMVAEAKSHIESFSKFIGDVVTEDGASSEELHKKQVNEQALKFLNDMGSIYTRNGTGEGLESTRTEVLDLLSNFKDELKKKERDADEDGTKVGSYKTAISTVEEAIEAVNEWHEDIQNEEEE